jgi:hypothetical protein
MFKIEHHFLIPADISSIITVAMIGSSWSPVVVKGPDGLPGMLSSGPLDYASLDIVEWLTA